MNRAANTARRAGKGIKDSAKGAGAAWQQAATLMRTAFTGFALGTSEKPTARNFIVHTNQLLTLL